jgi:aminotransferase in exopolysaccharide biosynthesis
MSEIIPLSVPSIKGNEWKYVKECLDTEWVSSAGKYVNKFEEAICHLTGSNYAIACVNGTAALEIALKLSGVSEGDEVIVPTLTFIASINVVRYRHASPVFMDCDDYYCIDVPKTIEFIKTQTTIKNGFTYNSMTGNRIAAIIPVHIFGNAVDLADLIILCRERNIAVVEDAAESIGTFYTDTELKGKYTGTVGKIGCYSFNGNKIITTGGGGMILTNDESIAKKARYLITQAKDDEIRYIHHEIGYNYRLTNIQAAMGVAQLERLEEYIQIKKKNYHYYKDQIANIAGLSLAPVTDYASVNYWMYCLQIDKQIYGRDREELMALLSEQKIQTRPVWHLNHLQKPYKDCQSYHIEKALTLLKNTLNIPCSVNLTETQIDQVCEVLTNGRK